MHVGFFGPTGCGKTTLAQHLSGAYLRAGRANLVCDPLGTRWPAAAWQTTDPVAFLAKAQASRNCILWIEESSITIQRDRDFSWLFTTARHVGHLTHVIGQDGSSLTPGMRQPLGTIHLFRCHPDLAETWSRQFCDPALGAEAPTLERYEFLVCRPFVPVRRCRLDLSQK
jgi:energy-coupling factor transporter ATP-binding protein EcfA2